MNAVARALLVVASVWYAPSLAAQRPQAPPAVPPLPALAPDVALALEELSPRYAMEFALRSAWYRERPVRYYDFGAMPETTAGRVIWPIHGFDARGNPVAIRGQRPIFAAIPGTAGYTSVWRVFYLVTADRIRANEIRDVAGAEALVRRNRASLREAAGVFNAPIVPRGSRLERDSLAAMAGWFEGRDVQFFDFGETSLTPVPLVRFVRGLDAAGEPAPLTDQHNILDTLPVTPPYADLWDIRTAHPDAEYAPNALKSWQALSAAGVRVEPTGSIRNYPVAFVDGTRIARRPGPLTEFADLRSPFPPAPTPPVAIP